MNGTRISKLLSLLAVTLAILTACGCESDQVTNPGTEPNGSQTAPILPDPARLTPNLSFFDSGEEAAKSPDKGSKLNFINAYLRVVVIGVVTELVLAPPVTAFAVALHTIPSIQEDGSWIWVYTHVDGQEEVQIRLRGQEIGDGVAWQLRVTALDANPPLDNEVWFEGTTRDDGDTGHWTFYDPTVAGDPAVAELDWGHGIEGDYLAVTCLEGEDAGDALTYRHDAPDCSVEFHDASTMQDWYIRWNEATGAGSLMVPDYNDGQPACWDEEQNDTECQPLP